MKISFGYCPIFPSSKAVLHFCLANNISMDVKISDFSSVSNFKEEIRFTDGDLTLTEWLDNSFCIINRFDAFC
jgi:hypothetical protein